MKNNKNINNQKLSNLNKELLENAVLNDKELRKVTGGFTGAWEIQLGLFASLAAQKIVDTVDDLFGD
ncbi:bacteriocin [Aquimarina brevivitae]|uniref:Bacteriocin-like protein n=1 Tax=Aquimarina brevivitae TaxID=323412 RepID=A0A4Q7PI04_9FLAO|nr:bacteriocin [Aquimarina brevivitae]RZS99440.1 bacteriocin-like protein [Aquimarina brevivitae]